MRWLSKNLGFYFEQTDANDQARQFAIQSWLTSRKPVAAAGQEPNIETYRAGSNDYYSASLDCAADAFTSAARTLKERLDRYHIGREMQDWVQAQDQVFANCSEGATIPPEAAADAPEWLRIDRDYQIAAAYFYAARYPCSCIVNWRKNWCKLLKMKISSRI